MLELLKKYKIFYKNIDLDSFMKKLIFEILKDSAPSIHELFDKENTHFNFETEQSFDSLVSILKDQDYLFSAYKISTIYSKIIEREKRKKLGAYFTPPDLSKLLIQEVFRVLHKPLLSSTFGDICCGGGALLVPMARSLIREMEESDMNSKEIIYRIQECLIGIEIDPFLLFLTKTYLVAELDEHIQESGIFPNFNLYHGDALQMDPKSISPIDVIIGNPPYKTLTSHEHARLKPMYGQVMDGNSNLYPAFLEKSFQLANVESVLSMIIPTSLYSSKNFGKMRQRITEQSHVDSIFWLTNRSGVFYDVLQEISVMTVSIGQKLNKKNTYVRSIQKDLDSNFSTKIPNKQGKKAWPIPKSSDQAQILNAAEKVPFRIEDYGYSIQIGKLVWNRDTRQRFVSYPKNGHRYGVYPIIWPFQITHDGNFISNQKFGHKKENFIFMGKDTNGLITEESIIMKRTSPAGSHKLLVCTVVPKTLIEQYGGIVGENHVIIISRRKDIWSVDPSLLVKVLNSTAVNLVYHCFSGTVTVSRYALQTLPMPDPKIVIDFWHEGKDTEESVFAGYGAVSR